MLTVKAKPSPHMEGGVWFAPGLPAAVSLLRHSGPARGCRSLPRLMSDAAIKPQPLRDPARGFSDKPEAHSRLWKSFIPHHMLGTTWCNDVVSVLQRAPGSMARLYTLNLHLNLLSRLLANSWFSLFPMAASLRTIHIQGWCEPETSPINHSMNHHRWRMEVWAVPSTPWGAHPCQEPTLVTTPGPAGVAQTCRIYLFLELLLECSELFTSLNTYSHMDPRIEGH